MIGKNRQIGNRNKDPLLEPQIWLEQNIDFWCAAMATMT